MNLPHNKNKKNKKNKKICFIDDVLEINDQICCILSGPPCIAKTETILTEKRLVFESSGSTFLNPYGASQPVQGAINLKKGKEKQVPLLKMIVLLKKVIGECMLQNTEFKLYWMG